jgi:hypothetical protein
MKRSFVIFTLLTLAKGPFTYITIKGPGIIGDLSVTNPALLDFFAFADFSRGEIEKPLDPGEGYEIIRSFVDRETNAVQNFDLLHYYPETGYVYYDGLIGGSSEYDGKWYEARPEVEADFRAVLAERARLTWIPFAVLIVLLAVFFFAYRAKPVNLKSSI